MLGLVSIGFGKRPLARFYGHSEQTENISIYDFCHVVSTIGFAWSPLRCRELNWVHFNQTTIIICCCCMIVADVVVWTFSQLNPLYKSYSPQTLAKICIYYSRICPTIHPRWYLSPCKFPHELFYFPSLFICLAFKSHAVDVIKPTNRTIGIAEGAQGREFDGTCTP